MEDKWKFNKKIRPRKPHDNLIQTQHVSSAQPEVYERLSNVNRRRQWEHAVNVDVTRSRHVEEFSTRGLADSYLHGAWRKLKTLA